MTIGTEKQLLAFMNGKFITVDSGIKTTTREDNKAALTSAIALAGGIKTKFNEHIASGGALLQSCIDLAIDCKNKMNIHVAAAGSALDDVYSWANQLADDFTNHLADLDEHKVADETNVITADPATTLATLYDLIKDILDQYAAHNGDAEGGTPALTYHYAANTATHVLASVVEPTSLTLSITRLTDLKSKLNSHDADGASHGTPNGNQNTTVAVAIGTQVHPHSEDVTNIISSDDPEDLSGLITLVSELLTDYDLHEGDSELAADWIYHKAQEAANHSLASVSAPTTLALCATRLNDWKAKFNAHAADTTTHGSAGTAISEADAAAGTGEHPAQADTVNTVEASSTITTLSQLITLVTELIENYVDHEADAALSSAWLYHLAQEATSHALASEVAPTTLQECVTRLNDIKTKFNAHDADTNSHTTGSTKQVSTANAAYGTTNRVTLTGVVSGDKGIFAILNDGTGNVTGVGITIGNGYADIEFGADPQNDTIYSYQVLREIG
ncbi:MAG: hypothetical protein ABFD50_21800 [Smithella sp.]